MLFTYSTLYAMEIYLDVCKFTYSKRALAQHLTAAAQIGVGPASVLLGCAPTWLLDPAAIVS